MKPSTAIIQGSSRTNGDSGLVSDLLVDNFNVSCYNLNNYSIGAFDYENQNAEDDFINLVTELIINYERWVFLSPVYWYSISGQMKIFLDRFTDLLKWHKDLGRKIRGKSLGLISVSNDPELQPYYHVPVELSAEYLGMQFLGHQHVWIDDDQIDRYAFESLKGYMKTQVKL